MSAVCLICLENAPDQGEYHARCLRQLFGVPRVPKIDLELAKLHTVALAMIGHTSISGIQRKVSLKLTDRSTLQVAVEGGRYILKPQSAAFPSLPENEHVTTIIARRAKIDVPLSGLLRLTDGTLAYISKRFDRLEDGHKLAQEDFCQLTGRPPKDRYDGSAELLVRTLRRYATEPVIEARKLFRMLVFTWWTANGDMHLKNFSVLRAPDGRIELAPAYDLLSTHLALPDDQLSLSIGGNKKDITGRQWMELGDGCGLPERAIVRVVSEVTDALSPAIELIGRSLLPSDMKDSYRALLGERAEALRGVATQRPSKPGSHRDPSSSK